MTNVESTMWLTNSRLGYLMSEISYIERYTMIHKESAYKLNYQATLAYYYSTVVAVLMGYDVKHFY